MNDASALAPLLSVIDAVLAHPLTVSAGVVALSVVVLAWALATGGRAAAADVDSAGPAELPRAPQQAELAFGPSVVEAPKPEPVAPPVAERVEEPVAERVEAPVAERVEAPVAERVEAPVAERVEAPESAAPVAERVEVPSLEPAAAPRPELEAVPPPLAPATEPALAPAEPEPPQLRPLRERLARTSEALVGRIGAMLGGRRVDDELLDELEALLFTADLGVRTAENLLHKVRSEAKGGDADAVRGLLREAIAEKLRAVEPERAGLPDGPRPTVVLVLGVNGSGKTTTIGKLAARLRDEGKKVVLGAGDTFRAAATEQLQTWGERAGCEVVAGTSGGDPAAVAFDTVKAAVARSADVALIDTAGRLQTKVPLMEELSKIVRVIGREIEGAPHEVLLVLDANTGQNALSQAREFTGATGVTGLVLTKLDGTAKGGVIIGLAEEFGIPVRYVGVGESVEDLRDFSADDFVEALFAG